jgi:hypothetical protein
MVMTQARRGIKESIITCSQLHEDDKG